MMASSVDVDADMEGLFGRDEEGEGEGEGQDQTQSLTQQGTWDYAQNVSCSGFLTLPNPDPLVTIADPDPSLFSKCWAD